MVATHYQKTKGTSKAEIGEINTSALFQSVKDDVSLFGESDFSRERPDINRPKPQSTEQVLAKEMQLHLDEKQLTKLTAIEAKTKAEKLEAAAEKAAKLNTARAGELSEEISSVRDSIQQAKLTSLQAKGDETKLPDKDEQKQSYKGRLKESLKGLQALKKDIDPEIVKNLETRLDETFSEIEAVRGEMESTWAADLDSVKNVTMDLNGAKESINRVAEEESLLRSLVESLKLELDKIKNKHSDLKGNEAETESTVDNLYAKLVKAKSELKEALAKEAQIRSTSDEMTASIVKLALEAETMKQVAQEMKQKAELLIREAEATRIELEEAENKLKAATSEADEATADEAKALYRIKILSEKTNSMRTSTTEPGARTTISRDEFESLIRRVKEYEILTDLKVIAAMAQVGAVKAEENETMKRFEKTNSMRTSTTEPGARTTISRDEFESLIRKVKEYEILMDLKVIAAMAQVEAVKAEENEAMKRFEAIEKEIEDIKGATHEALIKAEMAEATKKAVEGELRRWLEREHKKEEETASQILVEPERFFEVPITQSFEVEQRKGQIMEARKLIKKKTLFSKKALLMNSLSNVFRKKKYRVEGGSPSYLPGEKPVW